MPYTSHPGPRWRHGLLALLVGGMVALVAPPALADTFTATGTAPTVTALTAGQVLQPANNGTSATYQINATIGDADTLADLTTVTLCLSLTSAANDECTTTNAQTAVKLAWTQGTNTYALTGSTLWSNQVFTSNYSAGASSMTMNFKFKIGEAARAGGWTAKVIARDDSTLTTAATDATYSVNYYGAVDTQRASQAFGALAPNGSAVAAGVSNGLLQVNGQTDVFLAVANFAGPSTATNYRTVDTSPAAPPAPGSFALDCLEGPSFSEGSAVRIGTTATEVSANQFPSGIAEGGNSTLASSCRLSNGGGLPTGVYTGAVTVSVAAG